MIPLCVPQIEGNEWKYIKDCLDTNWVSSVGSYVDEFEIKFAEFLNCKKAVSTVNGTAAIHLALLTLGIGIGDEVIVSSQTFVAPISAVKYVGAEPVFVDIDKDTWVMDATLIESLITEKTKAIIAIHIYGQPVNMAIVKSVAEKHNLFVIEDATESLGSKFENNHTGTLGDFGCFSFNGNKIITTGAGGMLVTNNEEYAKRAKYLSTQTKTTLENGCFYHEEIGYNFRMPNIVSAMGLAQLENLDKYIKIKIKNADLYDALLKDNKEFILIKKEPNIVNVNWLYSIVINENSHLSRDYVIKVLHENGISSRGFFSPIHLMPPFANCAHGFMGVTESISQRGINLPSSVGLQEKDVVYICDILNKTMGIK